MKALLIKNADVYSPVPLGKKDILLLNGRIERIADSISAEALRSACFEVIKLDAEGRMTAPGFIDQHVHFNGAGGEGGPVYRTPPLQLSSFITAGITTAVGLLGTDGCARSVRELLMKARALEEEGISTYIYTGSYQIPGPLFTSDIMSDVVLIDKVIGLKLACSDHRSPHISLDRLREVSSSARVGGIIGGKCGVIMVHIGGGPNRLKPLLEVAETSDIPLSQFVPTHLNRARSVLEECVGFVKCGGYVDFSTGVAERYAFEGAVDASEAVLWMLSQGADIRRITVSTDGNGVLTEIDPVTGKKRPLIAPVESLPEEFALMLQRGLSAENAVRVCSTNIAEHLGFFRKGRIEEGCDADIVLFDKENRVNDVIAKGELCMKNKHLLKKGVFEIR